MSSRPVVAAIDMGYGHLRPAAALAAELGTEVLQLDRPPLGTDSDLRFWQRARKLYEPLTRLSQVPVVGQPLQAALKALTSIPAPWPRRDLSAPSQGTRWLERGARDGVGKALADHLRANDAPLLTTFYAGAILAELHGATRLHCLVTDSEINRVWAPPAPRESRIVYYAPAETVVRRLRMYGVAMENIRFTGYPLPDELVGRDRAALERNYAARQRRLSGKGEPPHVVFAVGGAGAQVPIARQLVPGMKAQLEQRRLRLTLVAGRRPEVAQALRDSLRESGLEGKVEVLGSPDVFDYIRRFNALLADADVLWTKPSELTFFAALGLPLVSAPPVGVHEEWNLRWAHDRGAALPQHDPRFAGEWLTEWLEDGVLSAAARDGYERLPQMGLYRIADAMKE